MHNPDHQKSRLEALKKIFCIRPIFFCTSPLSSRQMSNNSKKNRRASGIFFRTGVTVTKTFVQPKVGNRTLLFFSKVTFPTEKKILSHRSTSGRDWNTFSRKWAPTFGKFWRMIRQKYSKKVSVKIYSTNTPESDFHQTLSGRFLSTFAPTHFRDFCDGNAQVKRSIDQLVFNRVWRNMRCNIFKEETSLSWCVVDVDACRRDALFLRIGMHPLYGTAR